MYGRQVKTPLRCLLKANATPHPLTETESLQERYDLEAGPLTPSPVLFPLLQVTFFFLETIQQK